ncbi:MAG: potassium channel family protein [Paludisphaera borealis]|uniref:potassium channel family protein n=1 Tax=Paludisphaera borealis TaxID=1387353 RepID=UPI0028486488|nr:potassium channel family protein [Paludisphaera borealis]MDR3618629.1 potassium channel family protein [Paludisphaera borealis]
MADEPRPKLKHPRPSLFRLKKMGGRYAWLCSILVLAILTGLPLREAGYGDLFGLLVVAILYSGANAATSAKVQRRHYVMMLTPVAAIDLWIMAFGGSDWLASAGALFHIGFLSFTGAAILGHITRAERMTLDTILGGVCVFLLIGVIFGYVFSMVETVFPGSLVQNNMQLKPTANASGQIERRPEAIYFSFITLTTVGYGDIVPARSLSRVLSILEALMGQIFLTTFLAFLVGNYLAQREFERVDETTLEDAVALVESEEAAATLEARDDFVGL